MIKRSRIRVLAVFFSLSGISFIAAFGIPYAFAQISSDPQDRAPANDLRNQAPPSTPEHHPRQIEKMVKTPVHVASANGRHRHKSFQRKDEYALNAPVPPAIYSLRIVPQPPDELTPLMPAFWTGDLVLPFTVP